MVSDFCFHFGSFHSLCSLEHEERVPIPQETEIDSVVWSEFKPVLFISLPIGASQAQLQLATTDMVHNGNGKYFYVNS